MVIIDGDVEDPKAQAWVKTVTDGITAAGGTIHGRPDWWGKRQFAYPINRKETGYYLVVQALAEGGALDELERTLRLADEVVRHKLIRLPETEAGRRLRRHLGRNHQWQTTPSPSSGTSPAIPSSATPPAAAAWPASAWP
jgi:small subunit ribosomal protein S6